MTHRAASLRRAIVAKLAIPLRMGQLRVGRHLRLRNRLSHLAGCRRGSTAMVFAAASLGFLGLVGLATEAGNWYMANRTGQNAADAAAVAGAMTYATTGLAASTLAAARDTAIRNGFTAGGQITVTPSRPPTMGSYTGNNSAVEVIINQTQSLSFSRLFNASATRVSNRAVAVVSGAGTACVLALTGNLTLTGNTTVTASNCMLAGNNNDPGCFNIGGSAYANVLSVRCVGGCSGCASTGHLVAANPFAAYSSPTVDPFKALASQVWSPHDFNGNSGQPGSCDNARYGTGNASGITSGSLRPTYSNSGFVNNGGIGYCNSLHMQSGDSFVLTPGTYIWYNSDIKIDGGSLTCPTCTATNGVSIVQLGTSGHQGTLSINSSATVTLSAGSTNTAYPNLAGVVFYRENVSSNGGGAEVGINGGANTVLSGGFYFPGATASYNGNSTSACTIIVGGTIDMSGTSTLNQSGCSSIGTPTATSQTVGLVE